MATRTIDRTPGWRTAKGPVSTNTSGFRATGFRVLLIEDVIETTTAGGLILPEKAVDKERQATVEATVIEIGPDAWADKSTDYCEVGDRVIIGQYAGKFHTSPVDGKVYRFLADLDIITPVEKL